MLNKSISSYTYISSVEGKQSHTAISRSCDDQSFVFRQFDGHDAVKVCSPCQTVQWRLLHGLVRRRHLQTVTINLPHLTVCSEDENHKECNIKTIESKKTYLKILDYQSVSDSVDDTNVL